MKTIVFINWANIGSTGRILYGISALAEERGWQTFRAYPKSRNFQPPRKNDYVISSIPMKFIDRRLAFVTGRNGCTAWLPTLRLLRWLDRVKPDVLHLHNLHDSYVNLPMLFGWIKRHDVKVVWTLHDCWSFTGHCPHFVLCGCERWRTGCGSCPQTRAYPAILPDTTAWLWKKKREWFTGVKGLTVVAPSRWLAELAKASYLGEYPVEVVHNGIDLETFRPTPSEFRAARGIPETEKLVLGVAMDWGASKGLDVFEQLAARLGEGYRVVLVGTNEALDERLPKSILSIHRTHDARELAALYTAADVFVNPTRQDTFPTVNLEALACGTSVVTFRTGGSPETVDETCGAVVDVNDVEALLREVVRACEERPFRSEDCVARAGQFERDRQFAQYLRFYE